MTEVTQRIIALEQLRAGISQQLYALYRQVEAAQLDEVPASAHSTTTTTEEPA